MSIQPDITLAACPVCGKSIMKLDHVQKCVDTLRAELQLDRALIVAMADLFRECLGKGLPESVEKMIKLAVEGIPMRNVPRGGSP